MPAPIGESRAEQRLIFSPSEYLMDNLRQLSKPNLVIVSVGISSIAAKIPTYRLKCPSLRLYLSAAPRCKLCLSDVLVG